jgi:integrase
MANRIGPRIPCYRRHRASGQAVVTLCGQDVYLGKYGSKESKTRYDTVVNEWLARGRRLPERPGEGKLVKELVLGYFEYCSATMPEVEVAKIKTALRLVREMYGETAASKFDVDQFLAIRQKLIRDGLCISTIRDRMGVIRRMTQWGVQKKLVAPDTFGRIEKVLPLRARRDRVKPSRKIRPVPWSAIRAVLPCVNRTIAVMLELQSLTGARSEEICRMTTGQIERGPGDDWLYRPTLHKNVDRGQDRTIPLNERAQQILAPLLKADPDAALFCPREAAQQVQDALKRPTRTERQRAKKRKKNPRRAPGEFYDHRAYGYAVRRGCLKAGVPVFTPRQIRHTVATWTRQHFTPEHAQVLLGHKKINTTELYAEVNQKLAREVVTKIKLG